MRNKLKTLVAVAVLGAATAGLYSGIGIAADDVNSLPMTVTPAHPPQFQHKMPMKWHRHHEKSPWHLGLNRNKHLTAADARVIAQAALLMRGHHDLQVGSLETKTMKNGFKFYVIDIVNTQNKTVSRVVLNSRNGHIFPFHHQATNK